MSCKKVFVPIWLLDDARNVSGLIFQNVPDPIQEFLRNPDYRLGIITVTNWALTIDTPRNNAWIKSYMAKWGEVPGRWGEFGYTASQCIREVAEALNGDIEDIPRTAREIRRVAAKIETPSGPLAFDQYNQRDISVYVQKVEKRDGKLANVIFESLGKFGQQEVWKWWYKK